MVNGAGLTVAVAFADLAALFVLFEAVWAVHGTLDTRTPFTSAKIGADVLKSNPVKSCGKMGIASRATEKTCVRGSVCWLGFFEPFSSTQKNKCIK